MSEPRTLAEMTPADVAEKIARLGIDVDVKYRPDGSALLTGRLPLAIEWGPPNPPRRRRGTAPADDAEVRADWDAAWAKVYAHPKRYPAEYSQIAKLMPMSERTLRRYRKRLHLEPPPH
jgi:hypothetical protein